MEIVDILEEDPASRRVRAETRLKLLAKWDPKRYGDKLELAGDPARPLVTRMERVIVRPNATDTDR